MKIIFDPPNKMRDAIDDAARSALEKQGFIEPAKEDGRKKNGGRRPGAGRKSQNLVPLNVLVSPDIARAIEIERLALTLKNPRRHVSIGAAIASVFERKTTRANFRGDVLVTWLPAKNREREERRLDDILAGYAFAIELAKSGAKKIEFV